MVIWGVIVCVGGGRASSFKGKDNGECFEKDNSGSGAFIETGEVVNCYVSISSVLLWKGSKCEGEYGRGFETPFFEVTFEVGGV